MRKLIRHKTIWILAAALSFSLIVAALTVFFGGRSGPFSDLAHRIARPFSMAGTYIDQNVSHIYGQAFQYDQLLEENQRLKEQLAQLQAEAREGSAALRENALLRDLLELRKTRREFSFESAKIIAQSATNWSASVTINKGDSSDLTDQDCVIDSTGALFGVVSEVGTNWSSVYLITDASFEMSGQAAVSGEVGVLEGDFSLMSAGKLKLSYLSRDTEVKPGDEILTYATEGSYPSGLLVGTVETVAVDPSGMYCYAVILPAADLGRLSQVFVITDFTIED